MDAAALARATALIYRPSKAASANVEESGSPGIIDPSNYAGRNLGCGYQPSALGAGSKRQDVPVPSAAEVTPRRRASRQPSTDLSAILEAAAEEELNSPPAKLESSPPRKLQAPKGDEEHSLNESPWAVAWRAIKTTSSEALLNLVKQASEEAEEDRELVSLVASPIKALSPTRALGGQPHAPEACILDGHPISELQKPSPAPPGSPPKSLTPPALHGRPSGAEAEQMRMRASLDALTTAHAVLHCEVKALRTVHERLERLERGHDVLQRSFDSLSREHAELQSAHCTLQLSHEALQKMQRQLIAQQPATTDVRAERMREPNRSSSSAHADAVVKPHALPAASRLPPPNSGLHEPRRSEVDGFSPSRRVAGGVVLQASASVVSRARGATDHVVSEPSAPMALDLPTVPTLKDKVKPLRRLNPGLASRLAVFSPRRHGQQQPSSSKRTDEPVRC